MTSMRITTLYIVMKLGTILLKLTKIIIKFIKNMILWEGFWVEADGFWGVDFVLGEGQLGFAE